MSRIRLTLDVEYDADLLHGDDQEARDWFHNSVLQADDGSLSLYSQVIGDTVGTISNVQIEEDPVGE